MMNPLNQERRLASRGFTLTELLVVVAIMGVMTVSSASLPGLLGSRQVAGTVYQLSETLEQARSYAMAQNTYVWVGFASSVTNGIDVRIQASRDQSLNAAPANLVYLGKTLHLQSVALNSQLPAYGGRVADAAKITDAGSIQFSPLGEASLASGSGATQTATMDKCIEVGLQPLRGGAKDSAALQIAGLTGQSVIYRP